MKKIIVPLLLTLLSACIEVGDLNGYWEKAILDASLEGKWEYVKTDGEDEDAIMDVTHGGDVHVIVNRNEPDEIMKVKELVFDSGCKFLVERKEQEMGTLVRYMLSEGTLITYSFSDDGSLGKELEQKPLAGLALTGGETYQGLRVAKLDEESIASLKTLCSLPVWQEMGRYTKIVPS